MVIMKTQPGNVGNPQETVGVTAVVIIIHLHD